MLVSESLDQFLGEWVDRAEDRWADREIDRYQKRKTGVVLEEDPEEILSDPYDLDYPDPENIEAKKRILEKIISFKKNQDVTPEEFKNFCVWASEVAMNPQEAVTLVSIFIDKIPSMVETFNREKSPDGGTYHEGFEVIQKKYRPDQGYEDDEIG
jgi:hypothetical protein